ncbi:MAG: phosphomannomutase/phosphoglucomutase [Kordiimonadaceae bacterium]|jgi:phosphomannomutase|nr:phosphomannomutase/phosphoglucomutase [Kordiimonadaceae bacterium]MBT6330049.1 phosphomannomutase/phosphoglucomutase [Kordiimonadaceae bacterium]MBT7581438.1 phosphomannomutase/phosphoglucomutase [Kordiimonadaceae bacterium]
MTIKHQFNKSILREYDIRGVVGESLTQEDATALGRAFGTVILRNGGKKICLGFDGRLSSPMMEQAILQGLLSTGLDVVRVGLGPSPMLYYSVFELDTDGGIMITGSHNPANYNGFKMMIGKGGCYGEQIQEIGRLSAQGDLEEGSGSSEKLDIFERYIDRMIRDVDMEALTKADMTVGWDAGNGAAGDVISVLTKRLPGKHILLNEKIDGTFPAHHPDPTVAENLVELQDAIAAQNMDMGVAFDGDGDRIGAVDQQGEIIWGDQLLAILAEDVLKDLPGSNIIADVKCSQVLFDHIKKLGGDPVMWKTGHSLIKSKMVELNAPLAGEMSGHIFFKHKYYGFDDAVYVALRLLNKVARTEGGLGSLRENLPAVVNTPEIRIECDEGRPFKVVDEVLERLRDADVNVNDLDGARVLSDDGWWLIRASNTQNVIVARCEAKDEDALKRIYSILSEQLLLSGVQPPEI